MSAITLTRILEIGGVGSLGCLLRFSLILMVQGYQSRRNNLKQRSVDQLAFPHHTLLVNVLGCFIMGFLSLIFVHPSPLASSALDAAFLIGFCGGLTTFSSFMLDTVNHFRRRKYLYVIGYLFITLGLCLAADVLGRFIAANWVL